MMMSEHHNRSCMCSYCFYRSVLKKPSLRRITAKGSRIDKLYLGKFIPLRDKKIVTARTQYDHLRNEKLQRETSSKLIPEKVLATSKKEDMQHTQEHNETDSNSVVLGLVTLKKKAEILQSSKSFNICACCSCNSSILARQAGTRYVRDNKSGKKMYVISRSRMKKEHRTIRSPQAKLIRSEPTTKSKLSSSVDRAAKVKTSICPLYNRQYHSENEVLDYSYGTMGEGNLQNVGAKNITKPSLITKNLITSGGDKLHTKKTEVEADETKSLLIENKYATLRSLKTCFCTFKLLKKVTAQPKIFKRGLKDLPEIKLEFPNSTNSKNTIKQKEKLMQRKPITMTTKSKIQIKNKKTISKESVISHCLVERNICPDRLKNTLANNVSPKIYASKVSSYDDTFNIENIMKNKTLNFPKRETFFSSTNYGNTIAAKSSKTSTRLRSLVQVPHVSRNYIKNKHTMEMQSPIQNVTQLKEKWHSSRGNVRIISSPHATNFLLKEKINANNTKMDRQKNASILALHNFYGNSGLGKKRGKFFKSTINRCFCKLVQYGKDKNEEKLATDRKAEAFCEVSSSVKNNEQEVKHLGSYKRRERSLNLTTSLIPVSISHMSCDSSIESRIGTKIHKVKRRRIQQQKCPRYRILKKYMKAPFWASTSSSFVRTFSRRNIKNSKYYNMSKESHSSIVQYEWKPTRSANKFQTNITTSSKDGETVDLKRYSCRLLKNKDRNPPQLYIINTAEADNIKNPIVSPPAPYLSHSRSMKDLQYFRQFSSNSQSLGLFSHKKDSMWHQTMSLRDPLTKYASVKEQFSNSYTDTVSYCACLGQHTSRTLLTKTQMNNSTSTNESGTDTDLRSTMRSYQHLQQFCIMNLNIVDPKIKQQRIKLFDCEHGCVESECDQFKCLNSIIHNRFRSQTSTMTSTPQPKQKYVQHFCRPQMNTRTLSPSSQVKEKCIHYEQGFVKTCAQRACPSEPKQGKQKNFKATKEKNNPRKITNLSDKSVPDCPVTCVKKGRTNPKGAKEKLNEACNQRRDPCKGTQAINPNKTIKGTDTRSKNGLTLVQNTTDQALLWRHGSEHQCPNSSPKRRREKRNCFRKKNTHADSASTIYYKYPPSVTESVQCKAMSNTTALRPRKQRNSFTTVTISGLITVCKKQRGVVVTQNSTCSFQTKSSRKPIWIKTIAAATATTRKKCMQKGTDPLYENPDLQCKCKCIRKQKLFTPKPYPRNVKLVDDAPADERNTFVTSQYGTKLRCPEKMKSPSFERGAITRKIKNYEYEGVSTKRECCVGTIRSQTKSVSSATEPCRARNVRFAGKLPKNSKPTKNQTEQRIGDSSYSFSAVFSTDKKAKQKSFKKRGTRFDNHAVSCRNNVTSLKRCFCTTSLKSSKHQEVYYMPVVTTLNNISNYQRECSEVNAPQKCELDIRQTNHKLYYAPYEFVPIECAPSECTERVIKRKQYKKINLSIENTDITNSTQFKKGTCAQLLPSNIDILSSEKNTKAVTQKKSYIRSTECTQDSRLLEKNIGTVKSSTDLHSDTTSYTSQKSITDSMGIMCNTGNLTGMTSHLNKHLYALRLETSPKTASVGVDHKKGKAKGVMGTKGNKNYRSQARLGSLECKGSDCAIGNYNPNKPKRLSPGECHPRDCALGNYNPKNCEKKILERTASSTQCNPVECALRNFNANKGDKRPKTKTVYSGVCKSGECLFSNNNLKKIEKKAQMKNSQRQSTVSRAQMKSNRRQPTASQTQMKNNRRQPTASQTEMKTNRRQATVSQTQMKNKRRQPTVSQVSRRPPAPASQVSRRQPAPVSQVSRRQPESVSQVSRRQPAPVSQRQNTEKAVPNPEKVERKTRQLSHVVEERRFKSLKYPFDTGVAITSSICLDIEFYKQEKLPKLPLRPCPPKPVRKVNQKVSAQPKKVVSSPSSRTVSIQIKPQKRNVIKKCLCNLMRMTSTRDKKIAAKQMDANVANVGVTTKGKYLEPELFYPYEKKAKTGTKTFCGGTVITKKSLSTMTEKTTFKNEKCEFKGKPCVRERTSGTMTQKEKLVREKPPCEPPCSVEKCKTPHICFSDYRITSRLSFDVELSKYQTCENSGSSSRSVPLCPTPVSASAIQKDKMPSRKTATTKLPSKPSAEKVAKYKNETQNYVHPSLKRCFCTMKLQKPHTHQQIVNFMTATITPFNNLKHKLRVQEKPSNLYSSNSYLIPDSIGRSCNNSSRKYSKSKIFNEYLNKFEKAVLTKLFRKSFDVKHILTKENIMQPVSAFQGNRCLYDSNEMAYSNEMKTIYPYNSNKFHNYTSCTILNERNRSRCHHHSRRHYRYYDLITKTRRHKRQYITAEVQNDFNKRPNFLNKLKNQIHSFFILFHRKKHRDAWSRENNKLKNHSERIKKKKGDLTTKVDILKASKSDRQKCNVVNNVDPLKTCKSDRQPMNPKMTINQQKSKRVKVGSPKVCINDESNTRHSKCTEQGKKIYSRFQSGDIELGQSRRKDYLPKFYKHSFNNYQSLKCTQYNPNVHKQRIELVLKHGRKKKRKEKSESACCKDLRERVEDKRPKAIRKMKIENNKNIKGKFAKERRKSKGGEEDRR